MHHKPAKSNPARPIEQFKIIGALGIGLGRGFDGHGATRDPHIRTADLMHPAVSHSTLRIRKELANVLITNKQWR